jgi:hypothetical protein
VYEIFGIMTSRGANNNSYSTGLVEAQATNQLVNTYWKRSDNTININNNMNYSNATAYVTVKYTKTTD